MHIFFELSNILIKFITDVRIFCSCGFVYLIINLNLCCPLSLFVISDLYNQFSKFVEQLYDPRQGLLHLIFSHLHIFLFVELKKFITS